MEQAVRTTGTSRSRYSAATSRHAVTPMRRSRAALQKLETAADSTGVTLYQANLRTYQLLRYGVQVQIVGGAATRDGATDRLG